MRHARLPFYSLQELLISLTIGLYRHTNDRRLLESSDLPYMLGPSPHPCY